ncbi:MAG: cupin domain-containing protein [Candidatus Hydrogenedentes bacterium]|nr:cupin domain-containing protein [Candidatus Hydrogenedentota bacterium]
MFTTVTAEAIPCGQGISRRVVTDLMTFKVTGKETNGQYALIEMMVPPEGGPPLHIHTREDEGFWILEGALEFQAGEQKFKAGPGTYIHSPRDLAHTYKNIGSQPARALVFIMPAGFEEFFLEIGEPATAAEVPAAPPSPEYIEHLVKTAAKYGCRILLPTVSASV